MRFSTALLSLLLFSTLSPAAHAAFCAEWSEPKAVGALPKAPLDEASGMAVSSQFPNRIYWINDSGDSGRLYYTDLDGSHPVTVNVDGLTLRDAEALALDTCPDGPCVIVGDVGDNSVGRKWERKAIDLYFVPERADFGKDAKVTRKLKLKYPDGAHDCEAMAVLPGGDLLLFTKELHMARLASGPSGVYRVPRAKLHDPKTKELTLTKLGELPLPRWFPQEAFIDQAVTDAAVNPGRGVLGLLTYGFAVEIPLERLAKLKDADRWKRDADFQLVKLRSLRQQESLAYAGERMLWSTEFIGPDAPIYERVCRKEARP